MCGEEEKEEGFHPLSVICTLDNKNACVCLVPMKLGLEREERREKEERGRKPTPRLTSSS